MLLGRPAAVLVLASLGCSASSSALRSGQEAARRGRFDEAVAHLERALAERPDSVEARIALTHARLQAARLHLDEARRAHSPERAVAALERALELDPTNRYAAERLEDARARRNPEPRRRPTPGADPRLDALVSLEFEDTSLRRVVSTLGELAGVNVLFDEAYRDRRISVKLSGVSFLEALDLLTRTHGLFYVRDGSRAVTVGRASPR